MLEIRGPRGLPAPQNQNAPRQHDDRRETGDQAISSILRIHPGSPGASLRLLVMVTFLVNWAANPRRNFSQKNGRSAIQLAPCPLVCVTATGRLAKTVTKKAFPEHALIFLIVPVLGRRPVRLCGGRLLCTVA